MALSYTHWIGDGVTKTRPISWPYIERTHVTVKVDGVVTPFSWDDDYTIRISPAPANGSVVEARRSTPRIESMVDFSDGSTLTETDLDLNAKQLLFIVQEGWDLSDNSMRTTSLATYDAAGKRIENVGEPDNPSDATTRRYVDGKFSESLSASAAAVSAAAIATTAAADARASVALPIGITRSQIATTTIPAVSFTVVGETTVGDIGAGATYVRGTSSGLRAIQDAAGTWFNLSIPNGAYVGWFGVKGDWTTDDSDALQLAFDSSRIVWLNPGKTYRITKPLFVRQQMACILGNNDARIKMDPVSTGDASVKWISSALVVSASAYQAHLEGFAVDHNAQQWPAYPSSIRRPGFFGAGGGDMYGVALLVMADKATVNRLFVLNSFDNGIGVGRFNETTGQQSQGPSGVRINQTLTYSCGAGKHAWAYFPNGHYFQGAGIDVMTAIECIVSDCYDIGSYNAYWADISGGARATFINCHSYFCAGNLIASDSAAGSNQPWNTGGFGTTITYAGSGWDKMPGGMAFYNGSYGTSFIGCVAHNPAMYGFVFDYMSSDGIASSCRVVNAGRSAFVICGTKHVLDTPVVNGAGMRSGEVAESGSVCPPTPAILVTGMKELSTGLLIPTSVRISNPVITNGQRYPFSASPTVKYSHAIHARTRDGQSCSVTVTGGFITAGTGGMFLCDSGSTLVEQTFSSDGLSIRSATGASALNLQGYGNASPAVMFQGPTGDAAFINYMTGKVTTLTQYGGASLALHTNKVYATKPIQVPAHSKSSLPSAVTAEWGSMIFVYDDSAGATVAFSDGTNWRRAHDRTLVA